MDDMKEIKKMLQMLRGQGVTEFKGMGIEVKLGALPEEQVYEPEAKPAQAEPEMSDMDLLMWSSGASNG